MEESIRPFPIFGFVVGGALFWVEGVLLFCRGGPVRVFFERYPAPGYRSHANGTLYLIGQHGYSWSSVVSGSNAGYLSFNYGGIDPQGTNGRASGRQVRCLQE